MLKKFAELRHTAALLLLLVILLAASGASAQVTPKDTVYQKPSLPTGPPLPTTPPPTETSRPIEETKVIVSPPQVIIPDTVREEEEKQSEKLRPIERLYYGGSFGLQFGDYTNISLLPTLTYKLTPKLGIGIGAVYHFIREIGISMNNYGGRGMVQVETFEIGEGTLLLHGEVEMLSREYISSLYSNGYYTLDRKFVTLPMAGIGYRQRIGEKASFDLLLLYNANDVYYNPYSNPVIRASFNLPFRK